MAPSPSVWRLARVCLPGGVGDGGAATGGLDNNPNPFWVSARVSGTTRPPPAVVPPTPPSSPGQAPGSGRPSAIARVVLLVTRWARYTPGTRWAEPGPGSWGPAVVALEPGAAGGSGRPRTWWVDVHTAATPTCTTCALGAEVFDFLEQSVSGGC